ncbi:hypothetical protein [uncultured Dokdonia sp.]|uniref:hypothetical protein n=1 Tax=uncultured Dokdonia sp. TaxID=575653 RepID=UPI0026069B22|nr:hypothetical protein [uncultured Dokdonia sp.]
MKTTILTNEIFPGDISVDSYPWLSLLEIVNWKIDQLDIVNESISSSLYYSIILDLAGIIEGFTNQTLDTVLDLRTSVSYTIEELADLKDSDFWEDSKNEEDDFNLRLIKDVREKLYSSTWTGYNNIFKLIFGKSILEKIKPETWKGINSLFTLRNMIIHGKVLTINYNQIAESDEYSITVDNKYQGVYSYLTEKKIVEVGPTGYVELISKMSIDHYYRNMNSYIKEIVVGIENIKERNEIVEICSMNKDLVDILNSDIL